MAPSLMRSAWTRPAAEHGTRTADGVRRARAVRTTTAGCDRPGATRAAALRCRRRARMRPQRSARRGARLPRGRRERSRAPQLTWCVQRLVGSPACCDVVGGRRADPAPVRGERRSPCPSRPTTSPRSPRAPNRGPPPTDLEAHPLQAGAPVSEDSPTFAELGVRPEIVRALAEAGIERTFAIQELTLPLALAGEDVIGQARTGMGKTLGFGVPLLQRVVPPAEQPGRQRRRRGRRPHQGRAAGPGRGAHPRAVRPGRQGPRRRRRATSASGSPRSTAAAPTSRSSPPCARASTSWSAPRAACSTSPSSATSCSAASRRWCWTRPTRCWTWASCPTSSASCGCCPSSGRRCCSRPRCPARSSRCPGRS